MVNKLKPVFHYIKIALLVLIVTCIIVGPFMTVAYVNSQARIALREAKNVKLAFEMLTVEYYGLGRVIYKPDSPNGLASGVQERIDQLMEKETNVQLVSYKKETREVIKFIYENEHYRVIYDVSNQAEENWIVDYILPVLKYGEHEKE